MGPDTYLSSATPRWAPRDEQAIAAAAADGLLEETHYLDLKRELPGGRAANRELARDLAAFAVDGGTLLVGLDEGEQGDTPSLTPVPLAGLPERVEQVARFAVDPALPVLCTTIPGEEDPALGYLLVHVPISGIAPHMVDGVYYGRGDKTKTRLSDPEVTRLHRSRTDTEQTIVDLVSDYVARDPIPAGDREQAHLFLVAAPVAPRREMLLDAVDGDQWHRTFRRLVMDGGRSWEGQHSAERFSPDLGHAETFAHRADGAALTNHLTPDRAVQPTGSGMHAEDVFEVELTDEGIIRMMTTRFSDVDRSGGQVVFPVMLPVLVRRILGIAAAVADHSGYLGSWMVGVAATDIAGLSAFLEESSSNSRPIGLDQSEYRRHTTASYAELQQTPGAVTDRLVRRFLRSLGLQDNYRMVGFLRDAAPAGPRSS